MSGHVIRSPLLIGRFGEYKSLVAARRVLEVLRTARIAAECQVGLALFRVRVIQLLEEVDIFIIN